MKLYPYLLLPFFLISCTNQAVESADKPTAKQALAEAVKINKQANEVGYEWRDTGKWIKKAKVALKEGKEDKALKLAHQIKAAAEDGIQQAIDQKNAGPHF